MKLTIRYSETAMPKHVMVSSDMAIVIPPTAPMLIGYLGIDSFAGAGIRQSFASMKKRSMGGTELQFGEVSASEAETLHTRLKEVMKLFPRSPECESELQKEFTDVHSLVDLFNTCFPTDLEMLVY